MRKILHVNAGQSNRQGAAFNVSGGQPVRFRSRYTGKTDPFPGCNNINQGGSCFPKLIDLCHERGVALDVLNFAIGGAKASDYSGLNGAVVSGGSASLPYQQGYMDPVSLSGGSGVRVEGQAGFDPFGFNAAARAEAQKWRLLKTYDEVLWSWLQGESDTGVSAAFYQACLESWIAYALASNATKVLVGVTSMKATATLSEMQALQAGVASAIQTFASTGKVFPGTDLFAKWQDKAPLYPETTGQYVHVIDRGQEVQAHLENAAMIAAGA